jgi:hypothetical protein
MVRRAYVNLHLEVLFGGGGKSIREMNSTTRQGLRSSAITRPHPLNTQREILAAAFINLHSIGSEEEMEGRHTGTDKEKRGE